MQRGYLKALQSSQHREECNNTNRVGRKPCPQSPQQMNTETTRVAECEIHYYGNTKNKPLITDPKQASDILRDNWNAGQIDYRESFKVLLINNKNKCLGVTHIGDGGMGSCPVDIKLIMRAALLANAYSIILCHNHPSGELRPSSDDKKLTMEAARACSIMGIKLIDHVIISSEDYFSFQENALP